MEAAWKELLARHSKLILKVAWKFASDRDEAMSTYLYVCEQLATDGFRTLRSYDPDRRERSAKVSTWLTIVVRNLCIERRRQTRGRRRFPRAVAELSALDQKVFELHYWNGVSQREIVRRLETDPHHDPEAIPDAIRRLKALELEGSTTWTRQLPERVDALAEALRDRAAAAEHQKRADRRRWLETLLEQLPTRQRLAVRWYYWNGMSASGISRLLEVSQRRVYTLLDRALEALRQRAGPPAVKS